MVKTIHVHIHGKTKAKDAAKTGSLEQCKSMAKKNFPDATFTQSGSSFKVMNGGKAVGSIYSINSTTYAYESAASAFKDEALCSCQSHAKDATLVHTDKGRTARLYTGVLGKVLEVDEAKKRAYIEVQSAREGTYKMWVDFTEVESL